MRSSTKLLITVCLLLGLAGLYGCSIDKSRSERNTFSYRFEQIEDDLFYDKTTFIVYRLDHGCYIPYPASDGSLYSYDPEANAFNPTSMLNGTYTPYDD